jgi:hypothetical protein
LIPICISTVHGKGLAVLLESIKQYAPECPVYLRGPESVIEPPPGFSQDLRPAEQLWR